MFRLFKAGAEKIKGAFKKTNRLFTNRLLSVFKKPIDEKTLEELEQILYEADLGSNTTEELLDVVKEVHRKNKNASFQDFLEKMKEKAEEILSLPPSTGGSEPLVGEPQIIMIVGVNGSGKTTSIAKLAYLFQSEGKKVLLAAGDTFRAAANEQLGHWADKLNLEIVKSQIGSDPSGVMFDAITKAKAKQFDVVLFDTAGRLESKTDLMKELEKIIRVAKKSQDLAPHEIFLVIDATLGQTALEQARVFQKFAPLTGLILTKVDGSAKGGSLLPIYRELLIPIRYLCFGETMREIDHFDPKAYTEALFSQEN